MRVLREWRQGNREMTWGGSGVLVGVGENGGMWVYDLGKAYSNNVNGTDGLVSLRVGDDRWRDP